MRSILVSLRDSHIQDVMQVAPLITREGESWHSAP